MESSVGSLGPRSGACGGCDGAATVGFGLEFVMVDVTIVVTVAMFLVMLSVAEEPGVGDGSGLDVRRLVPAIVGVDGGAILVGGVKMVVVVVAVVDVDIVLVDSDEVGCRTTTTGTGA